MRAVTPYTGAGRSLPITELSIARVKELLTSRTVTAVELVARHLERVIAYDQTGPRLNAIPVLNPDVFDEAAESDRRYRLGSSAIRPLEGVPFTVKDSYMVRGLTVANGSPAFEHLIASDDAFTVARLREAGAVLIGKTNMPPLAAGGMQRGVYGRAESPYNPAFLTAAYASGSSNGSGTSTAASMAVFGMGEETVSSGRSPASNNGLCAYTPSRGLISIRGNWPLFPSCDVVVPHSRSMDDLMRIVDVLAVRDEDTRGDFWRHQTVVSLPSLDDIRPASIPDEVRSWRSSRPLAGKRLGIPRMYLGLDEDYPVQVRDSVRKLWEEARAQLEALGAEVIDCDFPLIKAYEGRNQRAEDLDALGDLPQGWMGYEFGEFAWWGWQTFLRLNAEAAAAQGLVAPAPSSLAETDGPRIFPLPPGALPDRYDAVAAGAIDRATSDPDSPYYGSRHHQVPDLARAGLKDPASLPDFEAGLRGLEAMRRERFERWLNESNLDGLVFPANGDVGPSDADANEASADLAWTNGVLYSNGNYVLRHLGIPTVTVPMGVMSDIGMPVGLTFAGPAYSDFELLSWGLAFEESGARRITPPLTPELPKSSERAGDDAWIAAIARQLGLFLNEVN